MPTPEYDWRWLILAVLSIAQLMVVLDVLATGATCDVDGC